MNNVKILLSCFLICAYTACDLPPAEVVKLPPLATNPVRITTGPFHAFKCSGVTLYDNWVITAAHCFDENMQVENLDVQFMHIPQSDWNMLILYVPGIKSGPEVTWVSTKPSIGDTAVLVGWGCDYLHKKVRDVKADLIEIDGRDLYYNKTNCAGDSGGAAYDTSGRLIGLMTSQTVPDRLAVVQYLAE